MNIDNLAHLHFPEALDGPLNAFKNEENESLKKNAPETVTLPPIKDSLKNKKPSIWNLAWKLGINFDTFFGEPIPN